MIGFVHLVAFAFVAVSGALSSDICHRLVPRAISLNDLEGQWYFVLATFHKDDCDVDCTGFYGTATNATHGTYMVTDRRDYNPILTAELIHRRIYVHGRDPVCCKLVKYAYQAAVIEDNYICFYFCGGHKEHDYAQCFGRSQDVTTEEHERMDHSIRYFGLTLGRCTLRRVNREYCCNRINLG